MQIASQNIENIRSLFCVIFCQHNREKETLSKLVRRNDKWHQSRKDVIAQQSSSFGYILVWGKVGKVEKKKKTPLKITTIELASSIELPPPPLPIPKNTDSKRAGWVWLTKSRRRRRRRRRWWCMQTDSIRPRRAKTRNVVDQFVAESASAAGSR